MATAAVIDIKAVKSNRIFLTVLTNPQSLNLPSPVTISLNKLSNVQCIAKQSRPPVKILIAIDGQLITEESKYRTEIVQKSIKNPYSEESSVPTEALVIGDPKNIKLEDMRKSFYDTITNLTISDVAMGMQDKLVECFVYEFMSREIGLEYASDFEKSALKLESLRLNTMSTNSRIQVNYAPEVRLELISASKVQKEEDVISLVCNTKATPEIHSYK